MRTDRDRPQRSHIFSCAAVLLLYVGCSDLPHKTESGDTQTISISDAITPKELYAAIGDEVRWMNNRDTPVLMGFLGNIELQDVLCERGFRHLWGMQDFVTIPPHDYVSLCFSRPRQIRYNVWWDQDDLRRAISRTATIQVKAR